MVNIKDMLGKYGMPLSSKLLKMIKAKKKILESKLI